MSAPVTNSNRILPPNVTGRSRGSVELQIKELKWTASKNFASVQAKIIWWGESFQSGAILKIDSRAASNRTINYQIQTNAKLFYEYLRTCEPIEIKISSSISNLQIGTAFVRFPDELGEFVRAGVSGISAVSSSHKSTHQIFSPKNSVVGEVIVAFNIYLTPNQTPRMVSPCEAITSGTDDQKIPSSLLLKSTIPRVKQPALLENSSSKKCNQTSSKAYGYLTGRTMSRADEIEALNELKSMSPTGSFIEALSCNATGSTDVDLRENIDSLRIKVVALSLSKAGEREKRIYSVIGQRTNVQTIFIVECKLSPFLLKINDPEDPIRFCTEQVVSSFSKIEFNKDAIRFIRIPSVRSRDNHNKNAETIQFTVWSRECGTKLSQLLGIAAVQLSDILTATKLTYTKVCPLTSITGHIVLGTLHVQFSLGCRGIHFGADFMDAVAGQKENFACDPFEDRSRQLDFLQCQQPSFRPACGGCCCVTESRKAANPKNCHHDDPNASSGTPTTSATAESSASSDPTTTTASSNAHVGNTAANSSSNCVVITEPNRETNDSQLLCGLLYIGSIFHLQKQTNVSDQIGHFIVCRGFWQEDATATSMCENNVFNFLEMFPVICNAAFFERTHNQFLQLELWQKQPDNAERMIGTTNLPLHQFYVAFRDPKVMQHLSRVKLPVVSIDGWTSVVSPLAMMPVAKVQVVLAIGTEEQLEYLKALRGLSQSYLSERDIMKNKIPVPATPPQQPQTCITNKETQTHAFSTDDATLVIRQTALSEMLNSFIDNLASRLPERNNQQLGQPTIVDPTPPVQTDGAIGGGNVQIRRTSDLLDTLQRALMCPPIQPLQSYASTDDSAIDDVIQAPPDFQSFPLDQLANGLTPQVQCAPPITEPHFAVLIEIENAVNISKIFIRVNKKCGKQRGRCKAQTYRGVQEVEPSTYVTFDASGPPTSIVHSPDGPVYTTNVAAETSYPQWNKRFEVLLPVDLMLNEEKRFILKVWRKTSTDIPQARLLPNPIEDMIIGFTAIDLGVLLTGTATISGWYNIIDFSGRITGQIKVNIQPKEDLDQYRKTIEINTTIMHPLTVDVAGSGENGGTVLSRTLKRKFTELEEISQRLRARLFDVTGDVNVDPDDEFENDLNTHPDEDEDDAMFMIQGGSSAAQYDWLSSVYGSAVFKAPSPVDFQTDATHSVFDDILKEAAQSGEVNDKRALGHDDIENDDDDDDLLQMYTKAASSGLQLISSAYADHRKTPNDVTVDPINNIFDWEHILSPCGNPTVEPLPSTSSIGSQSSGSSEQDRIRLISKALQKAAITDASAAVVTATSTTSKIQATSD